MLKFVASTFVVMGAILHTIGIVPLKEKFTMYLWQLNTGYINENVCHPYYGISLKQTDERLHVSSRDVYCLAKNVYHEARGEHILGQYAVAQVTINRMKSQKYPSRLCDVVYDKHQFSWTLKSNLKYYKPRGESWENSLKIAEKFLLHGYRLQGLENSLYFHADYVKPKWSRYRAKEVQIGRHIFYNDI